MKSVALGEIVADARSGFASGEEVADGVVQVRMNNVTVEGAFDWSKLRRVPRPARLDELLVKPNDILLNATNSPELVGKNAVFTGFPEPVTYSNHFIRLRLDERKADSRLVSRWLSDQWRRGTFKSMCRQWVNQASLNKDQLLSLSIPLPSLEEQRRIAAILDQADDLRRKRREAMHLLPTLERTIFDDMFGATAFNSASWPRATIGDLCFVKGGKRLPKGEEYSPSPTPFRYIRVSDLDDGKVREDDLVYLKPETQAQISSYTVQEGDIIISIAGSIGLIAPVVASLSGANLTENAAKLVRRNPESYDTTFLSHMLQSPFVQNQIQSKTGQVTIGKLALFRISRSRSFFLRSTFSIRSLLASRRLTR